MQAWELALVDVTTFYMDDSGTRNPDHKLNAVPRKFDHFALGGILIKDEDIPLAKQQINEFRLSWPQLEQHPLHSYEIRSKSKNFNWLGVDKAIEQAFLSDLERLLCGLPVTGIACVIDRPGYNARYIEKYGRERWMLCKSAFTIAVERAVKHVAPMKRKLRVYVEGCSKKDDLVLKGYYDALREHGHCFDPKNAAAYAPLNVDAYQNTLYEFRIKNKTSLLMQVADLYLWPISVGGYDQHYYPYRRLRETGKLIECLLSDEEFAAQGSKYYCFDNN